MSSNPYNLNKDQLHYVEQISRSMNTLAVSLFLFVVGGFLFIADLDTFKFNFTITEAPAQAEVLADEGLIENGIHVASGLIAMDGYQTVYNTCAGRCHSIKLVVQNHQTRKGWKDIIVWMQETQNLNDLGSDEKIILDYLSMYYAPEDKGRRENLKNIDWYEL